VDPGVEQVVFRCLDVDPAPRPASALAVAAALPGGDPLAAALAAGETALSYASSTYVVFGTLIALAVYGFHTSLAGRAVFGPGFWQEDAPDGT